MYRSTPHSSTLRAPADLMFSYRIRDKLPTMNQPLEVDGELQDRDKEKKNKEKEYAAVGDLVLAKRHIISNKLQSPFKTTPYRVVERNGAEFTIQNTKTLACYRCNLAHVKQAPLEGNSLFFIFKSTIYLSVF